MDEMEIARLGRADREALDALVAAGFDPEGVPPPLRVRAQRLMGLLRPLAQLDGEGAGESAADEAALESLTERTLRRVGHRQATDDVIGDVIGSVQPPSLAKLCEADCAALDALIEAGFEPERVDGERRPRAERLAATLSLLDHLGDDRPAGGLVNRTLQHVSQPGQQPGFDPPGDHLHDGGGGLSGLRLNVKDVAAAVAILLVGVSLLWPTLSSIRGTARQLACQSNLASAGAALASYGADHQGLMPATRARLGDPWWSTGHFDESDYAHSNSAHLFVLVAEDYIRLGQLACPENPDAVTERQPEWRDWPKAAAVSFSYQNQYAEQKPRLDRGPRIAVLADKNPFFEPGEYHRELPRDANSPNHTRRGQNVLLTDGHVAWLTKPLLEGRDNIFHAGAEGRDHYEGLESPVSADDSFLVP